MCNLASSFCNVRSLPDAGADDEGAHAAPGREPDPVRRPEPLPPGPEQLPRRGHDGDPGGRQVLPGLALRQPWGGHRQDEVKIKNK